MNRSFKKHSGEKIDAIEYARKVLSDFNLAGEIKIYVGCDSQNKERNTTYVGVIAFRYPNKGTHYIYTRENVKKIKDRWERLSKEVELSVEIATALKENGIPVHCVDLDFNKKEMARSHVLVSWARGWVTGIGFNCTVKPEEQVASRAADHLVKR